VDEPRSNDDIAVALSQ